MDFAEWAHGRWAGLVRAAIVLGCTLEEGQDLAQTTLERCYGSWRRVQDAHDPEAYVYRILLNCHRDSRRRRWWGERPTDLLPDRGVADQTDRVDTADAVRRALADLTAEQRQVVALRFYAHLSEQQTAEVLGVAVGTVKSRLSRALRRLEGSVHLTDLNGGH